MNTIIPVIITALLLQACAYRHHDDVRPDVSGIHSITLQTDDRHSGYQSARPQIDYFCEERQKRAYIVSEKYKYTGSMSESDYQASKAAAKVAQEIGGTAWALNDNDARHTGGIGQIASDVLGAGYTYTMTFRCK